MQSEKMQQSSLDYSFFFLLFSKYIFLFLEAIWVNQSKSSFKYD